MKKRTFFLVLCSILLFSACASKGFVYDAKISEGVLKTNSESKYKATFVAEVTDSNADDLIMFLQGNYQLDKQNGTTVAGELVQTVFGTPSSIEFGFYDETYVTISDNIRVLSDLTESNLYEQFLFAPAIDFLEEEINSVSTSESSSGTIYTISIKDNCCKKYLENLFGDDIYTFSNMKKVQKDLTEYTNFVCKYVISDDGYIVSSETSYTITAYDTVPYYPGSQATQEQYKRTFNVSVKLSYKQFGNDVTVDISRFVFNNDTDDISSEENVSRDNDISSEEIY